MPEGEQQQQQQSQQQGDQSQQQQGQQQGQQQQQTPWHGLTAPEDLAWVASKGWKEAADAVKSYRGAEKLIGRDPSTLVPLPRADDPAGYRAVLAKLGLPETPDKYEFAPAPGGEKLDAGYEKWARETFHKAGLTAAQVKALTAEQNAYAASLATKQAEDYRVAYEADKAALMAEWRGGYERMVNAAKTAATSLGYTEEMIDAMEGAVGYAATMKFFASLGQKLGEDGFVTAKDGAPKFAGTLTPAEAKAQWEAMKMDPVIVKALMDPSHPSHKAQTEKKTNLFKIMNPESRSV